MEPVLSIADIAERTGLSYDTIRYYEKIGLQPPAKRAPNGQRTYDKSDLERFVFITRLKRTQMPLKEIERYMKLAAAKELEGCSRMLVEHKRHIESQMAEMSETLKALGYKIEHFEQMMHLSGLGGD
ncbi:MerR family transcriptional regulator [Paenibacillus glycinis]|uniref:MerR family transcriptional regulator n=1 Tax=Paenibacillus glycinis TaxID=2697035 RepID=A0ABW9XKQ8_9BACL|nr:MerR family transcriptional regulator [Paenibacillus glycinis]NBD23197.1 MerR family transcriptional regulator [Paenibacillus glycinis]